MWHPRRRLQRDCEDRPRDQGCTHVIRNFDRVRFVDRHQSQRSRRLARGNQPELSDPPLRIRRAGHRNHEHRSMRRVNRCQPPWGTVIMSEWRHGLRAWLCRCRGLLTGDRRLRWSPGNLQCPRDSGHRHQRRQGCRGAPETQALPEAHRGELSVLPTQAQTDSRPHLRGRFDRLDVGQPRRETSLPFRDALREGPIDLDTGLCFAMLGRSNTPNTNSPARISSGGGSAPSGPLFSGGKLGLFTGRGTPVVVSGPAGSNS